MMFLEKYTRWERRTTVVIHELPVFVSVMPVQSSLALHASQASDTMEMKLEIDRKVRDDCMNNE